MTKSRLWTALGGSLPDPSRRGSRPVLDGRPDRVLRPPPDAILPGRPGKPGWHTPPNHPPPLPWGGPNPYMVFIRAGPSQDTPPEGGPNHPSRNRSQTRGVGTLVSGSRIPGTIRTRNWRPWKPGFQTHPKPHPLLGPSKVAPNLDPNLVSDRTLNRRGCPKSLATLDTNFDAKLVLSVRSTVNKKKVNKKRRAKSKKCFVN